MNAGELKHIISIMRPVSTRSETGAEVTTYTTIGPIKAKVVWGNGHRSVVNEMVVYGKSVYFTVRIYNDVRNTDNILFDGQKYRILAIEKKDSEQSTEITAELIPID